MLSSTWLKTLYFLRFVRGYGYGKVSESSFVFRQGGNQSDMFRIVWGSDLKSKVSLQDYHKAFLTSPLFKIELFLLSIVQGASTRATTRTAHLEAVARGDEKSVGPWTLHAVEGDPAYEFDTKTPSGTCRSRIMRCRVHGTCKICETMILSFKSFVQMVNCSSPSCYHCNQASRFAILGGRLKNPYQARFSLCLEQISRGIPIPC